jgi:hypothetical protein
MEDFKRRSTASFGGLDLCSRSGQLGDRKSGSQGEHALTAESHLWLPSLNPVYRQGSNMEESSSDDEMAERQRRAVPVVGSQEADFDNVHDDDFEYDETVGSQPSMEFCSQLDKEDESDMIDMYSLQFDDTKDASCSRSVSVPSDKKALPPALKKPALERKNRLQKRHKRVSFTGIPEPPKPYVPPHKRASKQPNNTVPDFVKNPQAYTHYEFDEPVVVGGGIAGTEDTMK